MTMVRTVRFAAVLLALATGGVGAQVPGMPDARQMSGVPLLVGDLPNGTVTVRVVRGAMTNPIPNQIVELLGGPTPATATTNDAGRAEFHDLQPGIRVKAATTVDGVRLESQEFPVPATGGVRVALVASATANAQTTSPPSPAQSGFVALGEQSRVVIEVGAEALNVFDVFQLLNTERAPVQTPQPIVFELPDAAQGAGLLDGSTPQATLSGKRVIVNGPFQPGSTLLQFAYSIPFGTGTVTIDQRLPAELDHVAVVIQKVGPMSVTSPEIAEQREMPVEGQRYIAARGRGLKAGDTLSLTVSGLPHETTWPRNLALALATVILGAGLWASLRSGSAAGRESAHRRKLEATRDRLFAELTSIEDRHREGVLDPERYAADRRELIGALERIYRQMDEEAAA